MLSLLYYNTGPYIEHYYVADSMLHIYQKHPANNLEEQIIFKHITAEVVEIKKIPTKKHKYKVKVVSQTASSINS